MKNNDFIFGSECENFYLDFFKKSFGHDLKKTPPYHIFDYETENIFIEIKSRKKKYNSFNTTMIGYNKILAAQKTHKEVFFYFNFLDGLYFIKYEKNIFSDFEIKKGGRWDRGFDEITDYVYIPIDLLIKAI